MTRASIRAPAMLAALLASSAIAHADAAVAPGESLYARMGGTATVSAVVNELVDHVARDARTQRAFDGVNLGHLKKMLNEQICSLSGGGCTYTGDSMKDVHAGLKIEQSEFYALVQILRDALKDQGVGLAERNELLQILAPMKRDVVER